MAKKTTNFYSSILNRIKRQYKNSMTNVELLDLRKLSQNDIKVFLQTGETSFIRKVIVSGNEKYVKIRLEQSLSILRSYYIDKSIVEFASNSSMDAYDSLCQSYFGDIITYIQACKDLNKSSLSYLESDICLLYIFTLTYWEKYIDIIEPYIIKGLEALYDRRINHIRPVKGDYGKSSIYPLAIYLCDKYERPRCIKDSLSLFYKEPVPVYSYALDNILTNDTTILNKCVDDLVEFHINKSKTTDLTYPFHKEQWIYFPIEIISLLVIRSRSGLSNQGVNNQCLLEFFLPYINACPEIEGLTLTLFHKILEV